MERETIIRIFPDTSLSVEKAEQNARLFLYYLSVTIHPYKIIKDEINRYILLL